MTRNELIDALHGLAKQARESDETLAAAGVLFCLCGAMATGDERELLNACAPFTAAQLERLTGEPDWNEDTLSVPG